MDQVYNMVSFVAGAGCYREGMKYRWKVSVAALRVIAVRGMDYYPSFSLRV